MITTLPTTTKTSILTDKKELVWNSPRTVKSLLDDVNDLQMLCSDYSAPSLSDSFFRISDDAAILDYQDANGVFHSSALTPHSLSQLCTMAGIPFGYLRKCIDSGSDWGKNLAEDNLNTWLEHSDISNAFMREFNGNLRGVLSSRYSCFDAPDIASVLNDNLTDDFDVVGSMINEERFHARIINRYKINNKADKNLCWGFYVDSSDVGRSPVSITLFIWRQACCNGLVVPLHRCTTFSQVHRGLNCSFEDGIINTINNAAPIINDMSMLIDKASDVSISDAIYGTDSLAREKLTKTIKSIANISDKEVSNIFYYLDNEIYEPTLWGLANAMTEAAQRFNLEKRISMEKSAGKILLTA